MKAAAMLGHTAFERWLVAPFDGRFAKPLTDWRGETVRSWPLPEATARRVVTTVDGRCFVAQDHHLLAIDGEKIAWAVETAGLVTDLTCTGDRRVVAAEEQDLIFLDARTGSLVARRSLGGLVRGMSPTSHGVVVQCGSPGRAAEVWSVESTGDVGARCRLDVGSWQPPRVVGDQVVVADGGRIRGLSAALHPTWIADRHGFHDDDDAVEPVGQGDERIETPLRFTDPFHGVAGISWSSGYAFFRFDLRRRRVDPVPTVDPRLHVIYPMVLAEVESDARLVTVGVDRTPSCIHLFGGLVWRRAEPSPPIQIAFDGGTMVLTVHSPRADVWRAYRDHLDGPSCFLRLRRLDDGTAIGLWEAPGPIAPCVALAPDGVMAVAEGTLFQIR